MENRKKKRNMITTEALRLTIIRVVRPKENDNDTQRIMIPRSGIIVEVWFILLLKRTKMLRCVVVLMISIEIIFVNKNYSRMI